MHGAKIYVLEAAKFTDVHPRENVHVGYMRAHFRTKKDACSYYDRHNKHMRSLNALNTWSSDWDPETRLYYIVRDWYGLKETVPPFDPKDEPVITFVDGAECGSESKYLK